MSKCLLVLICSFGAKSPLSQCKNRHYHDDELLVCIDRRIRISCFHANFYECTFPFPPISTRFLVVATRFPTGFYSLHYLPDAVFQPSPSPPFIPDLRVTSSVQRIPMTNQQLSNTKWPPNWRSNAYHVPIGEQTSTIQMGEQTSTIYQSANKRPPIG